jgi:DNA primase
VENVVASSGTSLTEDQLRLIAQLTKNLTILYDGDPAGIKAALRGMDMALSQSFNVQLVLLPEGEDPDSFIQKSGAAKFHEYVKGHKQDIIGFKLEVGLKEVGTDPVKKSKLVNEIAESISRINKAEDFALQGHYIREASRKLDVEEAGLVNLVNKHIRERIEQDKRYQRKEEVLPEPGLLPMEEPAFPDLRQQDNEGQEWQLIRVLIEYGDKPYEGFADVADLVHQRADPELIENVMARQVFDLYYNYKVKYNASPGLPYFMNYPDTTIQQQMITLLQTRNDISPKWSENYGIETLYGDLNYLNDVDSTLVYFELKKIKLLQDELSMRLKEEKEPIKVDFLIKKYIDLKTAENEILRKVNTVIVPLSSRK